MIRRIETQSTALKIRLWMVILICLQAGPMHTCYCEENGVAAAKARVVDAIESKDYGKAAVECKELAVVASMPEEIGKYAESAFLSITRGDDVAYLAAMKGVINHPSAKPEQKTMLLDLMINAPLGAEKYLLVKQGAQLIYTVPSLLNADSAPMITLAAHVACQNLNDTEGAVEAARKLLQTPESELRVIAAKNITYGAIHFSSTRIGSSDRTLKEIVDIFKSDKQIMDSEAAPVVLYAGIMGNLHNRTIEGVKGELDELFALHKAKNKEVEKDVLFFVGHYVEQLMQSDLIAPEGNQIVFPCYKKLLEVYPDCNEAKYAAWRLFEHSVKQGDTGGTIVYGEFLLSRLSVDDQPVCILYPLSEAYFGVGLYENAVKNFQKYLLKALATDPRRENVVKRLKDIEGIEGTMTTISDDILSRIVGGCPKPGPKQTVPANCSAPGSGCGCASPCQASDPPPEKCCNKLAACACNEYNYICSNDATCSQYSPTCRQTTIGCTGVCYANGSCFCSQLSNCVFHEPISDCTVGTRTNAQCY